MASGSTTAFITGTIIAIPIVSRMAPISMISTSPTILVFCFRSRSRLIFFSIFRIQFFSGTPAARYFSLLPFTAFPRFGPLIIPNRRAFDFLRSFSAAR